MDSADATGFEQSPTATGATALLPTRPLRLRRFFVLKMHVLAASLMLVGASIGLGCTALQLDEAGAILRDERIWRTGVTARRPSATGGVTSHESRWLSLFYTYEMDVTFSDAFGDEQNATVTFTTLIAANTSEPLVVRYLPNDHAHVAVSWAMDAIISRWLAVAVMLTFGLIHGGAAIFLGLIPMARLRDAYRCAQQRTEHMLIVVAIGKSSVNGKPTFVCTTDGLHKQVASGKPLFFDGRRTAILGLHAEGMGTRFLVLQQDFYPLRLSNEEQQQTRERMLTAAL